MPPEPVEPIEVDRTSGSVKSYLTNSIPDNELPHTASHAVGDVAASGELISTLMGE